MNITLNESTAISIQPLLTGLIFADLTIQKVKRSSLADRAKFWKIALDHIVYPSSTVWHDDENASVITDAYIDMIVEWVSRNTMNACIRIERAFAKRNVEITVGGDGVNNFSISVGQHFVFLAIKEASLDWDQVNLVIKPETDMVRDFHGFLAYCGTLYQGDEPLVRLATVIREIEEVLDCERLEMQEENKLQSCSQHLNNDYVNLDRAREDNLPWAESIPRYIQGFYISGGISASQVRRMIKSIRISNKTARVIDIAGSLLGAVFGIWRVLEASKVYDPSGLKSRFDDLCSTSDKDGEGDIPSPSSQEHSSHSSEGDDSNG